MLLQNHSLKTSSVFSEIKLENWLIGNLKSYKKFECKTDQIKMQKNTLLYKNTLRIGNVVRKFKIATVTMSINWARQDSLFSTEIREIFS